MTEINVRPLPPILAKIAETELNEKPKRIPSDLEALKNWLDKQPHIIGRKDDQFLIAFLRGCKYSLERAKEKLDTYFTIKTACPEFFESRDPLEPKLRSILNTGITFSLSKTFSDGSRIIICRPCIHDPNKVPMNDVIKIGFMLADLHLMEDDYGVICGQTVIIDLTGMTMAHSAQSSLSFIKKISTAVQYGYPTRLKSFHFINTSAAFEIIFKIFYQFLSEKLQKRICIHSSLEELHAKVPKDFLPQEYGGVLGPIEKLNEDSVQNLIAKRDWFLEDVKYRTDESKRIAASKNINVSFGAEGSFRKLEID